MFELIEKIDRKVANKTNKTKRKAKTKKLAVALRVSEKQTEKAKSYCTATTSSKYAQYICIGVSHYVKLLLPLIGKRQQKQSNYKMKNNKNQAV